jgi:hypothetical protein
MAPTNDHTEYNTRYVSSAQVDAASIRMDVGTLTDLRLAVTAGQTDGLRCHHLDCVVRFSSVGMHADGDRFSATPRSAPSRSERKIAHLQALLLQTLGSQEDPGSKRSISRAAIASRQAT